MDWIKAMVRPDALSGDYGTKLLALVAALASVASLILQLWKF